MSKLVSGCQRAVASDEIHFGPTHPKTAVTLGRLAENYFREQNLETAEKLYRRILQAKLDCYGDHPTTAATLRSLALVLRHQNNLEEAVVALQHALDIEEQSQVQGETIATSVTVHQLVEVLQLLGRNSEATNLILR